jgi:hypothetical protein
LTEVACLRFFRSRSFDSGVNQEAGDEYLARSIENFSTRELRRQVPLIDGLAAVRSDSTNDLGGCL